MSAFTSFFLDFIHNKPTDITPVAKLLRQSPIPPDLKDEMRDLFSKHLLLQVPSEIDIYSGPSGVHHAYQAIALLGGLSPAFLLFWQEEEQPRIQQLILQHLQTNMWTGINNHWHTKAAIMYLRSPEGKSRPERENFKNNISFNELVVSPGPLMISIFDQMVLEEDQLMKLVLCLKSWHFVLDCFKSNPATFQDGSLFFSTLIKEVEDFKVKIAILAIIRFVVFIQYRHNFVFSSSAFVPSSHTGPATLPARESNLTLIDQHGFILLADLCRESKQGNDVATSFIAELVSFVDSSAKDELIHALLRIPNEEHMNLQKWIEKGNYEKVPGIPRFTNVSLVRRCSYLRNVLWLFEQASPEFFQKRIQRNGEFFWDKILQSVLHFGIQKMTRMNLAAFALLEHRLLTMLWFMGLVPSTHGFKDVDEYGASPAFQIQKLRDLVAKMQQPRPFFVKKIGVIGIDPMQQKSVVSSFLNIKDHLRMPNLKYEFEYAPTEYYSSKFKLNYQSASELRKELKTFFAAKAQEGDCDLFYYGVRLKQRAELEKLKPTPEMVDRIVEFYNQLSKFEAQDWIPAHLDIKYLEFLYKHETDNDKFIGLLIKSVSITGPFTRLPVGIRLVEDKISTPMTRTDDFDVVWQTMPVEFMPADTELLDTSESLLPLGHPEYSKKTRVILVNNKDEHVDEEAAIDLTTKTIRLVLVCKRSSSTRANEFGWPAEEIVPRVMEKWLRVSYFHNMCNMKELIDDVHDLLSTSAAEESESN